MVTIDDVINKFDIIYDDEKLDILINVFKQNKENINYKDPLTISLLSMYEYIINNDIDKFIELNKKSYNMGCLYPCILLSIYYKKSGSYDLAIDQLKILEESKFKLQHVYSNLGNIYYRTKKNDLAIKYFKLAIEKNCEISKQNLALLLMENKKYKEGLTYLNSVDNKQEITYYFIGLAYFYLNKYNEIEKIYEKMNDYKYIIKGFIHFKNETNDEEYIEYFNKTLESDNIHNHEKSKIIYLLCNLYFDKNNFREIIKITKNRDNITTARNKFIIGIAYLEENHKKKGIEYLLKSAKENDIAAINTLKTIINDTNINISNSDK